MKKVWLVVRVAASASVWSDDVTLWPNEIAGGQSGVPLRVFATEDEAGKVVEALNQQAYREVPFGLYVGSFVADSAEAVASFAEGVRAAGLEPPDLKPAGAPVYPERTEWGTSSSNADYEYRQKVEAIYREWWDQLSATTTPEQNARLWEELLGAHWFYDARAAEMDD